MKMTYFHVLCHSVVRYRQNEKFVEVDNAYVCKMKNFKQLKICEGYIHL